MGQVIDIGEFIFEVSELRQVDGSVKGDFSLRSLDLKTRIPSAPIRTVESPTQWGGMGEGGIDNPGVWDAKYELGHADAGQEVVLGKHLFIRRPVELGDCRKMFGILCDRSQRTIGFIAVDFGDEPMSIVLAKQERLGQAHLP